MARPWSTHELVGLTASATCGADFLALALGRSVASVKAAAARQGVSLRTPGRVSGRVVGQRKGDRLGRDERRTRLEEAERARIELAERFVVAEWLHGRAGRPLCPFCLHHPVAEKGPGMCDICYRRGLAERHRALAEQALAARELDAARQAKSRARSAAGHVSDHDTEGE